MTILMTILGIAVFVVGLLFSIGLHEMGHLSMAKLFGIRVPQWMVGFGPTMFSRHKGETEYGIKWIPLGGYIRMIGMFPPGADGKVTQRSTSPWRSMIEDARSAAYEELQPGDEKRLFYTRAPWKRFLVMFAGPFMNLVLAVVLFAVVMMGFGVSTTTTSVSSVQACVVKADAKTTPKTCPKGAPKTPASKIGLRPEDRIVAFDGHPIKEWTELQQLIRKTTGPATMTVERDGKKVTLHPDLIKNQVAAMDEDGNYIEGKTQSAGFLGFTPASGVVQQTFPQTVDRMGDMITRSVDALIALPQRIPDLWAAAFQGEERKPDSPMGVVGAARVGGDIFTLEIPASQRIATMVMLVAGFNLSLFLFNMLPLLPLDGGHMAGAIWESVRRRLARLFGRKDPGPFDVARMMPVAYVVAGVFLCFTVLVLIADVVNPLRIG